MVRILDEVYPDVDWPSERPVHVVGFGLNAVDWICVIPYFPEPTTKIKIQKMHKLGGGQVATASALCARYGLRVRYVGRVGDDEIGRFSLEDLRKEPMESCIEVRQDTFSQFAVIMVDRTTGERTILWDRDPGLAYRPEDLRREWVCDARVLHIDGHDQAAAIQMAKWAKEVGLKVSLDIDKTQPGVEELLQLTDFLIPGLNFVHEFSGKRDWKEGLLAVSEATYGFVAVTRGKAGAAAVWDGRIVELPGITVNTVDTTGAGDVFHGAFVYALLQNWSLGRCLRFANAAAALSCTRLGARGGIPPLDSVLKILDED